MRQSHKLTGEAAAGSRLLKQKERGGHKSERASKAVSEGEHTNASTAALGSSLGRQALRMPGPPLQTVSLAKSLPAVQAKAKSYSGFSELQFLL